MIDIYLEIVNQLFEIPQKVTDELYTNIGDFYALGCKYSCIHGHNLSV